ncbi:MAG: hypothetical protein VKL02_12485 [Cylindrospermopsis raciborskii 1523720]|nr:hypothetical protein [Cylindrospermopsis raciborskii]MEB3146935.1 hypothetical protein [Cylindrospermopsis raciborskii]
MIRVFTVVAESDFHLILRFSNDEKRRFDMRPFDFLGFALLTKLYVL